MLVESSIRFLHGISGTLLPLSRHVRHASTPPRVPPRRAVQAPLRYSLVTQRARLTLVSSRRRATQCRATRAEELEDELSRNQESSAAQALYYQCKSTTCKLKPSKSRLSMKNVGRSIDHPCSYC